MGLPWVCLTHRCRLWNGAQVAAVPDFQAMAHDPRVPRQVVADTFLAALKASIDAEGKNFIAMLVENGRLALLPEIEQQFRELKNAVALHQARAGGIVVLDAISGDILAMANLPSYNPNNRGKLDPKRMRNRAVTDLFEPGSTLKPFTAAAAMEAGLFRAESIIQTGNGTLTISGATIHDAHPAGALTV